MKNRFQPNRALSFCTRTALLLASSPLLAVTVTWDNTAGTSVWTSVPATPSPNWDTNIEPLEADDVVFPAGLAGTITLSSGENAKSLQFDADYTLSAGGLTLATASTINVASAVTATIATPLVLTGGSTKTGNGTLVLGASNTNASGIAINGGRLRITHVSALGAAGATVNAGTFLEISGTISPTSPISLKNDGIVLGIGTPTSNGILTIDPLASAVSLATDSVTDLLTLSTATNELTGGAASTVINLGGPGAIRLNTGGNFAGSWNIPTGRLELANATALGAGATSVTLSGGTLSARTASAITFTGPGANLLLTANSSILSDRTTATVGVINTFGTLSMGTHTLTVAPGQTVNSGTAAITLGNLTLSGNPTLAVNDSGVVSGKLTTGSLLGGGIARTITKTGAGDLTVTGGSTDLPAGSAFNSSGGGTIEMSFPNLGTDTTVNINAAQNPFGQSTISITDGGLRLIADGANNTIPPQTFVLPSAITLGGSVTLDPDRKSLGGGKIFELSGLTLVTGTVLSMAGDNTFGVRLTGPLALQGNATLKGIDAANKDGLLTLNGGISGAPATTLAIGGGTSPLNLTINAAGTYGGGTAISGGNVTLNAANALGTGPLTQNGGSLIVNTDGALNGTLNLTGGTLRVNDTNALAANPISLNGGTLDFRNNTTATITTGALTVSGASGISIGNNGSGSSQIFDFPQLNVSGNTTLTVTPVTTSFIPNLQNILLAGNLTISNTNTARIQTITEDGFPRTLIKVGAGTLELEGVGSHSGGTEVVAGTLLVENSAALGSGFLTLGDTGGSTAATAAFGSSLAIPNNLLVRSGGTGLLTFDSPSGGVTWNGTLSLQKAVTLDNGSSSVPSTFTGLISGSGNLTKISAGEIALTNAANSFTGAIALNDGTLNVPSNGALGDSANGVTLAGDAVLKIDGTFASSRTFTFTSTTNNLSVSGVNEFTLNSPLAGAGTFLKSGTGIMTIAPGVDSSARSGATSGITGGILRVQGVKNLSDTGIITLNGGGGTIEFLRDADTTFPHPVTADGTGTLHVDRAIGGSGNNGRHTLGTLGMASGTLTVTGANGYGLSLAAATVSSNNTITNNAPGTLRLASFTGNPGSSNLTQTFGGSGDTEITGALTEGAGTGNYGITKTGPGTLRFGTSVLEFGRLTTIQDGTLDLNGLSHSVNALTLGGAASALGARLVTGAAGSLQLGGALTFNSAASQAGAVITGNLDLGAASRSFSIANSIAAVDLTIDGPISGATGAAIVKSGAGTLRFSGAGNTQPGLVSVNDGVLELGKSSSDAIGTGGLSAINFGTVVRLLGNEQIHNSAPVSINLGGFLELDSFTETVGPLTFTQTAPHQYGAVKTGATGTLVLNGNITFNNNSDNSTTTDARNVLITGTGTKSIFATDGTLDLGGALRTIHVTTTTVSANAAKANATIETRIINGGILKTGPRTLYLTHPNNNFNGGLQIAEGTVVSGGGTSLGTAPVTFANSGATSATLDLGTASGTQPGDFVIGGSGSGAVTITYSALSPQTLELSGNFDLQRDLIFNVVNGSIYAGDSALLNLTGTLDDGAGTRNLFKIGDGTLKLDAGNTYSGSTTVTRGILAIPADSALGNSSAALTLDGGCLQATTSFSSSRNLIFGSGGGAIRVDAPNIHTCTGDLAWSSSPSSFHGSGTTILSGTTSGLGGDLSLGEPILFASTSGSGPLLSYHTLSIRGSASLPAGNLKFDNLAVLELGNSNFTRALGTAPGEVQFQTSRGGGWAAHGANRSVNLGGAGATVVWGQTPPAFLAKSGLLGSLVLGSSTATHTVDFQNPLELSNASFSNTFGFMTRNGSAAIDGRISGDVSMSLPSSGLLSFDGDGTLEISGDLSGNLSLSKVGAGTTILSGNNSQVGDLSMTQGSVVITTNQSIGQLNRLYVGPAAELNTSAMPLPLKLNSGSDITVEGLIIGDVNVAGTLDGFGSILGDVRTLAGSSVTPFAMVGERLEITGDFVQAGSSSLFYEINGVVPQIDFAQLKVNGAVNLAGNLDLNLSSMDIPDAFTGTLVLLLNDGADAINGIFSVTDFLGNTLPLNEGTEILLFDGRRLKITYLANGDGGTSGNDFGLTVLGASATSDLAVTASAPAAVDLGAQFTIDYTVSSSGPSQVANGSLSVTKPVGVAFALPFPPGVTFPTPQQMSIPLANPMPPGNTGFQVHFTAPASTTAVVIDSTAASTTADPTNTNNSYRTTTAVLAGGAPAINVIGVDPIDDTFSFGIDTIAGIKYIFQSSQGLVIWQDIGAPFISTGGTYTYEMDMLQPKEFYRFGIVPQGGN